MFLLRMTGSDVAEGHIDPPDAIAVPAQRYAAQPFRLENCSLPLFHCLACRLTILCGAL
jgi:hypothetical protein